MFEIKQLTRADAAAFRAIRLEGIERHPAAFGTAYEEEVAQPVSHFAKTLETDPVFGGFDPTGLVGVAGLFTVQRAKRRHKATLWGMYVQAHARGTGLADALVSRVLDHARGRFEIVQLSVAATNTAALRLYERHGFTAYGTEPRSLKIDGAYHDEILMYRLLD